MPGISGKKRFISMIDKSQKILINAFPMSLIFSQIYALSLQSFLCQMCAFVESTIAMEESGEVLRIWGDDVMEGRDGGSSAKLCAFTMVDNANVNPYTPRQS